MGRPLPLEEPDCDEDHQDKDEEGQGQPDVEGEVTGGQAGGGQLGVRDDGQVPGQLRAAQARAADPAPHVLPLTVTAAVGRGRSGAAVPPYLENLGIVDRFCSGSCC